MPGAVKNAGGYTCSAEAACGLPKNASVARGASCKRAQSAGSIIACDVTQRAGSRTADPELDREVVVVRKVCRVAGRHLSAGRERQSGTKLAGPQP